MSKNLHLGQRSLHQSYHISPQRTLGSSNISRMKNMRYLLSQPGHSNMQYSQGFQMSIQSIHPMCKMCYFSVIKLLLFRKYLNLHLPSNESLLKKVPPSPCLNQNSKLYNSTVHKTGKPFFTTVFVDISLLILIIKKYLHMK